MFFRYQKFLKNTFAIQTSEDTSSFSNPIELPMDMVNFAIIKTLVPLTNSGNANYLKLAIEVLLKPPYSYLGDDGNGHGSTGQITANATDNIRLK